MFYFDRLAMSPDPLTRRRPAAARDWRVVLLVGLAGMACTPGGAPVFGDGGESTGGIDPVGSSAANESTMGPADTTASDPSEGTTTAGTSGASGTGFEGTSGAATSSSGTTAGEEASTSAGDSESGMHGSSTAAGEETGLDGSTSGDEGASSGEQPQPVEVCDGIDNDRNGIIDDVDEGGDGVCDCIRIATLGEPGQWGSGDVFSEWLSSRAAQGADALRGEILTEALLEPYHVLVVENVSVLDGAYGPDEIAALASWVEHGGGVMTLIGYADPSEIANVNLLLEPFGMRYGEEQILSRAGGKTIPVTEWNPHPVSDQISAVGVDNGYPLFGSGQVYAREQGHDVGMATTYGDGRVSAWGDEWITYDSEWVDRSEYQVERFWLNTIKWLTPPLECQVRVPG